MWKVTQDDQEEYEAIETDDQLIAYIDKRIVAALPDGWVVTSPDEKERESLSSIQQHVWTIVPPRPGAAVPADPWMIDDDTHYRAFPLDRGRVAFVYDNNDAGPGRPYEKAIHILLPNLAAMLRHIFERPELFPLNEYGLS